MTLTSLRETSAPPGRLPPSKSVRPNGKPWELFVNPSIAARLWFYVAAGAVLLSAFQPFLLIRAYRTHEQVVIMDASGTFHVSPLLGFEEASKLHEQHALLACIALLQRNPTGFDQPELLEKLFLPEALQQARQDWSTVAEEFAQKHLHQKAEVLKLTVLETRDQTVLVQAEGQLLRMGSLAQQTFTEAPTFTVRFTLVRNPNLATNGRFPLAVWNYVLSS